jgi:hypothetical protein
LAQDDKAFHFQWPCFLPQFSPIPNPPRTKHLHVRKLNRPYGVHTEVGKINVYGFRFRRGGDMKTHKLWAWMVLLAGFAFFLQLSTAARAQDSDDQDQGQDPPDRVARLNYSQGSVSFRPAGEDDWVTAVQNRPIVTGDDLWADENSRAEVHVGSAAIRLGSQTGITFLGLDDNTTQIRLAQGSLFVRVRHLDDDDSFEIDTPNIAFTLLQPGEYRVDVSQDGKRTEVTTWHGRGQVTGGGFSYNVVAGQSASFTGDQDHVDYDLNQIADRDSFDDWAFERDEREDRADSANYVSREMTGYEDLDEYGDWSYVAGYGPCWHPRAVVVGWAPYRFGHWVYIGPWGWTWVEDEPWGFAPFHYGRWAFVSNGWFWVPGPVVVRPVWAPALVAFVGGSPGFHFSVGVGVGWFPLAPGEVYVPSYHVSRTYVNNINITNTTVNVTRVTNVYNTVIVNRSTTINNITYVNQRVTNGVTVVSHEAFVNARPVAQNIMRVEAREVVAAPVTRAVAVEPVRTSVIGAGRPVPVRPPTAVISRPVVAVRTPPPPVRSIDQRQAQAGGRLNEQTLVRPVAPARPVPTANQNVRPQPNQEGFRPFGQPSGGNSAENSRVKPMLKPQPRVYEQQGTPMEENRNVPQQENRNVQPQPNRTAQPDNREFRPPQQPTPQETHPLVRPAPPVQQRSPQQEQQQEQKFNQWHEQRQAAPPPQPRPQPSRPEPRQEKPPKK